MREKSTRRRLPVERVKSKIWLVALLGMGESQQVSRAIFHALAALPKCSGCTYMAFPATRSLCESTQAETAVLFGSVHVMQCFRCIFVLHPMASSEHTLACHHNIITLIIAQQGHPRPPMTCPPRMSFTCPTSYCNTRVVDK